MAAGWCRCTRALQVSLGAPPPRRPARGGAGCGRAAGPWRRPPATLQPVRCPGSMPMTVRAPKRRREQQRAEVLREDVDGLAVGAELELDAHLALDGGRDEALPRVGTARSSSRATARRASAREHLRSRAMRPRCRPRAPSAARSRLAAAHGEEAVRGHACAGLAEVVVGLELRRARSPPGPSSPPAPTRRGTARGRPGAHGGGLRDGLGDDVAGALQGLLHRADALLGVDEGARPPPRDRPPRTAPDALGEGVEALLRAIMARVRRLGL
jgi:hypothetical protein